MSARPLVWLTRPREDSESLLPLLQKFGCEGFIEPMLSIEHLSPPLPDLTDVKALVFTSANAVRGWRGPVSLPAYAVGAQTQAAAFEKGFQEVRSVGGDVEALAELISSREKTGPLLYMRGEDVSHPLSKLLPSHIQVEEIIVYRAQTTGHLSKNAMEKLRNGEVSAVLFFSARTVRTFVQRIQESNLERTLEKTKALCIGSGMVESLSVLPWAHVYVSKTPDRQGMIDLLERSVGMSKQGAPMSGQDDQDALTGATEIIERFGGIRPMANKINVPVTTVQGWKKRDVIPGNRRGEVMAAAQEYSIDISDLTSGSAIANENRQEEPKIEASEPLTPFAARREEAARTESVRVERVSTSRPAAPRAAEFKSHEELMAEIQSSNEQAIKTSVWATTGLILIAMAGGAFLLWPSAKKIEQNSQDIATLEGNVEQLGGDVRDMNRRGSFLKNLVPEDMQQKIDEMQTQARNIQQNMQQLSEQAERFQQGVMAGDAGSLSQRMDNLEAQFAELTGSDSMAGFSARIKSLEQSVAGQAHLGDAMTELQGIVDSLDGRVSTLEGKLQDVQGEDTALGQTLEGVSGDDLKAAAMLIAFSQLRGSLNRQAPFEEDLALMQKMVGNDNPELQEALMRLAPKSESGVLTAGGLSDEFKGLAGEIVVDSLKGEDVSVMDRIKTRIGSIFKVEKDGEMVTGTETQAAVNRAQILLDKGDIQGAITELQTLQGPAAQKAEPFIEQAQATMLAEQVQTMLYQNILSKISASATLSGAVPAVDNMMPQTALPKAPYKVDLNAIKQGMESIDPMPQEVIKDDESGVTILPRQQRFKGFSAGQE